MSKQRRKFYFYSYKFIQISYFPVLYVDSNIPAPYDVDVLHDLRCMNYESLRLIHIHVQGLITCMYLTLDLFYP